MVKRGYSAEARRKEKLTREGWLVFRVSGSIGPIDLVAIRPFPHSTLFEVRLEQIKSTKDKIYYFDKQARSEWTRLWDYVKQGIEECYFVILFSRRRKWKIVRVGSERPPTKIECE